LATLAFFEAEAGQDAQKALILALFEAEKPRIRAMKQIVAAYPGIPMAEEAQKLLYTPADLEGKLANMETFSFEEGQSV